MAKIRARTIDYRARDLEVVWKAMQGGNAKNMYCLVWEFSNGKIAEIIIHIS